MRWAGLSALLFVVLSVLVALGASTALDVATRELFRPDDVWGPAQQRADYIVEGLRPLAMVALTMLVGLTMAWRRRSRRPLVIIVLVVGGAAGGTLFTKFLLRRGDPRGEFTSIGGSYPSGHTTTVLACLGAIALLSSPRLRAALWSLAILVTCAMSAALLLEGIHWLTDVLASIALTSAVLCAAATFSPPATQGCRCAERARDQGPTGADGLFFRGTCSARASWS